MYPEACYARFLVYYHLPFVISHSLTLLARIDVVNEGDINFYKILYLSLKLLYFYQANYALLGL